MTFYIAHHSTGTVHLRKTDRVYTHAVVGAHRATVSWSGRRDLADKAAADLRKHRDGIEVVRAVEVDAAAFTKASAATKRKFKTVYMDKTYTKTVDVDCTSTVLYPVGCETVAHTVRHPVPEAWLPNAELNVEYARRDLERFDKPGNHEQLRRALARVEEIKALVAQGYHEVAHRGDVSVWWYYTEADATRQVSSGQCVPRFRVMLALDPVQAA